MASKIIHSLIPDSSPVRGSLIIIVESYVFRGAVKACALRSRSTDLREMIAQKMANIRKALSLFEVVIARQPYPSSTWWYRYLNLQPDSSQIEAMDSVYISMLHSTLTSNEMVAGIEGIGDEVGIARDPILNITNILISNRHRPVVIIDGLDSTLLIALWEMKERMNIGAMNEVYISPKYFPNVTISCSQYEASIRSQYGLVSSIAWSNFIVCLPFIIHAGLPPLLMLQDDYREPSMKIYVDAILKARSNILIESAEDSVIDLVPLREVVAYLASIEENITMAIYERCQERSVVKTPIGNWAQFKEFYYHLHSDIAESVQCQNIGETIRRRLFAYMSGFIQLIGIYRGNITPVHALSQIRMADSPLASDLLNMINSLLEKTQYVTVPTTQTQYIEDVPSKRTFGRSFPIFAGVFSE